MSGTWVWIVGLGLLLLIQNASATCDVKFADGLGKNDKRIFVLGETAELKCDVTAMDPTKDVLYWKYDEKVFTENDRVMTNYVKKYKVFLGQEGGKKIYKLTFKVEADDVGKYNCTCGSGGIQYPVWVKVPCNERKHVVKNPKVTSQEIIDYLNTNNTLDVPYGTEIKFKMGLDCKCTWPEVNRKFIGAWNLLPVPQPSPEPRCKSKPVPDGLQNFNVKPLSCYTGVGSVTFRYKDVIGSCDKVSMICDCCGEYGFYIDEGQETMPEPLMKIRCGPCPSTTPPPTTPPPPTSPPPTKTTAPPTGATPPPPPPPPDCPTIGILEITLIVTGIITLFCAVLDFKVYKYWKKGKSKELRRLAPSIIAVLAAVILCDTVVFWLRVVNNLRDLQGNPIPPSCKIGVGSIVGFGIILIVALIAIIVCIVFLCKERMVKEVKEKKKTGLTCKNQNCKNPVHGYFTPCHHSEICLSCAKQILKDPRAVCPTCRKIVDDYYYPDPKADNNTVNGAYARDQQPGDARTSAFSKIQKNGEIATNQNPKMRSALVTQQQNRNTRYRYMDYLKNDNVPLQQTKPADKKTDPDYYINTTCKTANCKNPIYGYFTPCRHSDICFSCAKEILKDPRGVCPTCEIIVDDYYYPDPKAHNIIANGGDNAATHEKRCNLGPCKNPVDGYFTPCKHSDICSSCAIKIMEDPWGLCPTPNCGMLVDKYMQYSDANSGVRGFNHAV